METLWNYHRLDHELRPTDVGIGLGSHDIGVAVRTAELYQQGLFPLIVFTGANAPTTIDRFPRGEAVHYRERALERRRTRRGDPRRAEGPEHRREHDVDPRPARRRGHHAQVGHADLSRPYQERRAYATCRKLWPEVELVCTSQQVDLDTYAAGIGDIPRMINVMVGDTQRIRLHAEHGYAIHQDIPDGYRPRTSASWPRATQRT